MKLVLGILPAWSYRPIFNDLDVTTTRKFEEVNEGRVKLQQEESVH